MSAGAMKTTLVRIPTSRIIDETSFHEVFAEALGFPNFYGHNMNAWIDCMSYADKPDEQMVSCAVQPGELMALQIEKSDDFATRCPEIFQALIECAAFVNERRVSAGEPPVLALVLCART